MVDRSWLKEKDTSFFSPGTNGTDLLFPLGIDRIGLRDAQRNRPGIALVNGSKTGNGKRSRPHQHYAKGHSDSIKKEWMKKPTLLLAGEGELCPESVTIPIREGERQRDFANSRTTSRSS